MKYLWLMIAWICMRIGHISYEIWQIAVKKVFPDVEFDCDEWFWGWSDYASSDKYWWCGISGGDED